MSTEDNAPSGEPKTHVYDTHYRKEGTFVSTFRLRHETEGEGDRDRVHDDREETDLPGPDAGRAQSTRRPRPRASNLTRHVRY